MEYWAMFRCIAPLFLILGCGLEIAPAPRATLPDDDDSADDGTDAANDDDSTQADEGTFIGALVELQTPAGESRWTAGISFDGDGGDMIDFVFPETGPLPGVGLAPELGLEDGCTLVEPDAPSLPLPATDDAGEVSLEADENSIDLLRGRGIYSGDGDGSLPDGPWVTVVGGGTDWGDGEIPLEGALPATPEDVLPGGGTLGSIREFQVTWTADPSAGAVEVLVHRSRGRDDWIAIRCIGPDNGSMRVRAEALAAATGPLTLSVSRADWGAAPGRFGLVRTRRAELVIAR